MCRNHINRTSCYSFGSVNLGKGVLGISLRAKHQPHNISNHGCFSCFVLGFFPRKLVICFCLFCFFIWQGRANKDSKLACGLFQQGLTVFYVAGDFVQQHEASMQVTDVLLHRKLKRHFKDTIVFPCLEFKHKLLFGRTVCFTFVLLHVSSWKDKEKKMLVFHRIKPKLSHHYLRILIREIPSLTLDKRSMTPLLTTRTLINVIATITHSNVFNHQESLRFSQHGR